MISFLLASLAALHVTTQSPIPAAARDAARRDAAGVKAGEAGQLDLALEEFREALRLDPEFADAHLHLALALERTGRAREAMASYMDALRLRPASIESRYGLASVCAKLGDLDGAIALLQQVVRALPQLAEAHYNLGVNLWNRYKSAAGLKHNDELTTALKELEAAANLDPREPRFHVALGQLLAERQELSPAIEQLRIAAAQREDDPEYAYNLALVLRLNGDLTAAEAQLRSVLRRDPQHARAHRALGLLLRQQASFDAAAVELRLATASLPDDAEAHHLLGTVLLKLNRVDEAMAQLREAIRLDPALVEARVNLAQALARSGEAALIEAARTQQAEVRRLNDENARIGRTLVLLQTASERTAGGDTAAAIAQLREAIEITPAFPEAHYQLGLALERASAPSSDIERTFRTVLQLNPDHAPARHHLGALLARRGDVEGAKSELQRAIELAPGLVDAHRELARIALEARDWTAAVRHLDQVLLWNPDDRHATDNRSRALASIR